MSDLYSVFPALVPSASEIMSAELLVKQVLEAKYPDLDLREGTGLRDLVLRPNAYALALQKKANDYYFANNTLSGVNDTTDETIIDDILSNWFMSRHTGVSAVISARLYFAVQKNVTVPVSTFFSTDNTLRFFPANTQTFSASSFTYDAYQNEWYVDIQLVAAAPGTSYNIGSGSLLYFTNFDPYFLHAEVSYLSQSATNPETNLQFITRSSSAISTRNLINIPSVASNLQANFNTLNRIVTVGMGDVDMIRDQIKVVIDPEDPRTLTSLTRSSTTATAILVEHGFYTGQIVNIVGCLPSGYNGQYSITVVDYQTFTFTVTGSLATVTALPTVQSYTSPCLVHTGGKVDVYLGDSISSTIVQLTTDVSGRAQITGPIYALTRSNITGGGAEDTIPYVATVPVSGSSLDVSGHALHITTSAAHGLVTGNTVSVAGVTQFKSITTLNCVNLVVTAVSASHGLSSGTFVVVSGVTPTTYNGRFQITVIDANTFTYVLPSNVLVAGSGTMIISNPNVIGDFQVTYTGTNTFDVAIPLVWATATNSIAALAITRHVTYNISNPYTQVKTLTSLSGSGTTVTATLNNHGYAVNRYVTIKGVTPSYYNGTFKITSVPGPTQFTFNIGSTILAPATGVATCAATIPWQDYGFSDSQVLNIDFGANYGNSTASFQTQYFNNVDSIQQYLSSSTNRVLCGDYMSRGFNLYILDLNVVVYNSSAPSSGLVQATAETYLAGLSPGSTFVLSDLVSALTVAGISNVQTPLGVSYTYYHRDLVPATTGNVVDYLDPLDKTSVFILGNVVTSSISV